MPLSGAQVTRQWPYGGPGHNYGSFAGKEEGVVVVVIAPPAEASGGFPWWVRYEQQMLRRDDERRRLEESVDTEIAALIRGEDAPRAETAAREYVDDLSALIRHEQGRQAEFRRFVDGLNLKGQESELARLMAVDRAMRQHLQRLREEEEFIQILLLAL